ncbi:MAG: type II-A CRISPR-associated protein Csn2 [Spirochaetales bacterium]
MKLVNIDFKNQIIFDNDRINVLVIENSGLFYNYLTMLNKQILGENGEFVLSDNFKEIDLKNNAGIVTDYVNLSVNDRRLITKLYNHLSESAKEAKFFEQYAALNSQMLSFLFDLENEVNINLENNNEFAIIDFLKLYDVKVEDNSQTLLEKLINYINLVFEFNLYKLLIFVNLKNYLSKEDLLKFYKHIIYKEYKVLLLESSQMDCNIEYEKTLIIDKDMCEIVVE